MVQICISAQTVGMEASSSTETSVLLNTAVHSLNYSHLNICVMHGRKIRPDVMDRVFFAYYCLHLK